VNTFKAADYKATHFLWEVSGKVATITLNRPDRKNPLTFESYAELGALFRVLEHTPATSRRSS
jgi:enoyl-CoA hydratase/carnithine racemase